MVTNSDLWIEDIHHPDAGQSLGLYLKIKRREMLAEESGLDAANSEPGDARTEYETLDILASLPGVTENEIVRRAKELARNGRFHFVPGREFDSLREFLTEIIGDGDDADGRKASLISDATFIAEQVVPFLEQHDMRDVALVVGRNGGVSSKLRAAIPQLRAALEDPESVAEIEKAWAQTLKAVADPASSEASIRKGNPEHGNKIPEIDLIEYHLPGGQSTIVMRVDPRQRSWVENRIGPKGCWHHGGKWQLDPGLGAATDIIGDIRDGKLDPEKALETLSLRKKEIEKAMQHVSALMES